MVGFDGYNDWRKKKKSPPSLSSIDLKHHSEAIFRLLGFSFTATWGTLKTALEELAIALQNYALYLDSKNAKQQVYHALPHPVRQISENITVQCRPATQQNMNIDKKYIQLDSSVRQLDYYQPLFLDETVHTCTSEPFKNSAEKYRFIENIQLTSAIDLLKYDCGGGLGAIVALWKIPEERTNGEAVTETAKMVKQLEWKLPEYHTRYMRKHFVQLFGNIGGTKVPQHILRGIYKELTLDASVDQNPSLDERLRQALLADDPDLIIDLRHMNPGRPGDTSEVSIMSIIIP